MPLQLMVVAPRRPELREYKDAPLKSNEVRFRSQFAAAKHGTEMGCYRGEAWWSRMRRDVEMNVFLEDDKVRGYPAGLGNMAVGVVTETGAEVKRYNPGDRVFCHTHFRETVTRPESSADLRRWPDGMSWQAVMCVDPAEFALGAVRDGCVRLGDNVAVFGMGAIGLLIAQLARLQGAQQVIAVDPLPNRRAFAERLGADLALDPTRCDAGVEIKKATGKRGADVTFEVSGSYAALHHAIRGVAFGGNVVAVAMYKECHGGLDLGTEWHFNRPNLISTRACSDPNRDHPRWDDHRIVDTAFRLLQAGRIGDDAIVQPVVPFKDVVAAYMDIDARPERSIKLGVEFPGTA
jgi:threonine dehydrogenase-like Zn-dependent dehydrogenase